MKIDESTGVPIGWFFTSLGVVIASVAGATFWISSVNDRLTRIEEKLGIPALHSETGFIQKAYGK